jgi:predicted DNA-binding WGR domain protein
MANPHYDPKNIGKTKAPAKMDAEDAYLKDFDQRNWSELSTKYQRGDTELKAKVAKLAREVPELRPYLIPMLRQASQTKVAHKPIMMSEGLTKEAVRDGRAFMVYKVDPENNNSKFYEGLIVPSGMGFSLIRRWGALTDSGQTGRIDGAKFDDDPRSQFPTLNAAKMELRKHYSTRVSHGYTDAFGADHTTSDGHKLPMGEYPVGLTRKPGFGWGSQSITTCSPSLKSMSEALAEARAEIQATGRSEVIKDKLGEVVIDLRTLAHTDSTMASKLMTAMSKVIRRLSGSPRFLPDPEGRALALELQTIQRYVSKQMSVCS